jgi:hypothetical protein
MHKTEPLFSHNQDGQTMACNFENGRRAGERLLRLFADLNGTVTDPQGTLIPAPLDTVSAVLKEIWSWSTKDELPEYDLGLFSTFLTVSGHSTNIIEMWGTNGLLSEQKSCAPMCNLPADSGIFGFAYWTGETDGDTWCYDIKYRCIRCIPVGDGDANPDRSRLASYGVFPHFDHFVAYLRCEAERRHFISPR